MSKKHYIYATALVAEIADYEKRQMTAIAFAKLFKKFSPRFDEQKFLTACGL